MTFPPITRLRGGKRSILLLWVGGLLVGFLLGTQSQTALHVFSSTIVNDGMVLQQPSPQLVPTKQEKLTVEITVTLLHKKTESWKSKTKGKKELGTWLLSKQVQDIPVTIVSPDALIVPPDQPAPWTFVAENGTFFDPHKAFSHLLTRTGRVKFLPIQNGGRAQEVPGYCHYILENYENLPDIVVFMHGHGDSEDYLSRMRYFLDNFSGEQIGFLHLNGLHTCLPVAQKRHWRTCYDALGFDPRYNPSFTKIPCCGVFMASRERILLRPKWFYQQLLKLAYERQDGSFAEHYWHIFFGEPAVLPNEREATHYFYKNYTRNQVPFQDAVLKNPYPNFPYSESMKQWYDTAQADPASYYPSRITAWDCRRESNSHSYSAN